MRSIPTGLVAGSSCPCRFLVPSSAIAADVVLAGGVSISLSFLRRQPLSLVPAARTVTQSQEPAPRIRMRCSSLMCYKQESRCNSTGFLLQDKLFLSIVNFSLDIHPQKGQKKAANGVSPVRSSSHGHAGRRQKRHTPPASDRRDRT